MHQRIAKQLANALTKEFQGKIYLDDVPNREPDRTDQFLTRALSAMVVRYLIECPSKRAADFVIDGTDDHDIDAIAYNERENRLWLVQSKWSGTGKAKIHQKDFKTFTFGVEYVLTGKHEKFNDRYRPHEVAIESIMDNDPKLTFVIAVARPHGLHPDHESILAECADKVGKWYSEPADIEVLTLDRLNRIARAGMGEPPIDLDVTFASVSVDDVPHRVYFGTVTAAEIARWHADYGNRLFRRNIRESLGRTSVNQAIRTTLAERPEHFWDFNNGITMVARSGSVNMGGTGTLKDVAIVNGAQTVSSIGETVKEYPAAGDAKVLVKISLTGEGGDELIREITRAANTQNRVEIRDLASLYEQQDDLRQEFHTTLGLEYATRHTEAAPTADEGCTNEEALIALACCHPDPRYAVQAKTLPDVLWDRSGSGAYRNLFRSKVTAVEVWRSVRIVRAVKSSVNTARKKLQGRAAQIAEHGDLFTAHLVARQFADQVYADDWEETVLYEVAPAATSTLKRLVSGVDTLFKTHASSLFKDDEKCTMLAELLREEITTGTAIPELPDDYVKGRTSRKNRLPDLVPLIAKHRAVEDGTILEFRPISREQRKLFQRWNARDPRRSRATWVNDGKGQLRWEVDGKTYAASRLALDLINSMGMDKRYKSIRGPECWHIPGRGSLKEIGECLRQEHSGEPSNEDGLH
ncbi:MAG: AIPR family protein [Gammaproteobacteria bacterium]